MAKNSKAHRHHAVPTQDAALRASYHVPHPHYRRSHPAHLPRHDALPRKMRALEAPPSRSFEDDDDEFDFEDSNLQLAHDDGHAQSGRQRLHPASDDTYSFLEESANLQKPVKALKVVDEDMDLEQQAGYSIVVLIRWLDLCANFHIISGAYIGLNGAYASKDYMGIWQNSVKVLWMWAAIYEDWLVIYSAQGGEVQYMDYVQKYTNSLFLSFSSLWAWNSWTGLSKAIATGFKTPADVWSFASNLSGFRCAMDINHIGWFAAIDLYSTTGKGVFSAGNDFILYSFSIDMLWNSVIAWYSSKSPVPAATLVKK